MPIKVQQNLDDVIVCIFCGVSDLAREKNTLFVPPDLIPAGGLCLSVDHTLYHGIFFGIPPLGQLAVHSDLAVFGCAGLDLSVLGAAVGRVRHQQFLELLGDPLITGLRGMGVVVRDLHSPLRCLRKKHRVSIRAADFLCRLADGGLAQCSVVVIQRLHNVNRCIGIIAAQLLHKGGVIIDEIFALFLCLQIVIHAQRDKNRSRLTFFRKAVIGSVVGNLIYGTLIVEESALHADTGLTVPTLHRFLVIVTKIIVAPAGGLVVIVAAVLITKGNAAQRIDRPVPACQTRRVECPAAVILGDGITDEHSVIRLGLCSGHCGVLGNVETLEVHAGTVDTDGMFVLACDLDLHQAFSRIVFRNVAIQFHGDGGLPCKIQIQNGTREVKSHTGGSPIGDFHTVFFLPTAQIGQTLVGAGDIVGLLARTGLKHQLHLADRT